MTCCQLADPALVAEEPEQFDCTDCPVAAQMAALDPDNREAWRVYRACCNRFLVDTQAVPVLLARVTDHLDAEDVMDLTERLRTIYDILQPKKAS